MARSGEGCQCDYRGLPGDEGKKAINNEKSSEKYIGPGRCGNSDEHIDQIH